MQIWSQKNKKSVKRGLLIPWREKGISGDMDLNPSFRVFTGGYFPSHLLLMREQRALPWSLSQRCNVKRLSGLHIGAEPHYTNSSSSCSADSVRLGCNPFACLCCVTSPFINSPFSSQIECIARSVGLLAMARNSFPSRPIFLRLPYFWRIHTHIHPPLKQPHPRKHAPDGQKEQDPHLPPDPGLLRHAQHPVHGALETQARCVEAFVHGLGQLGGVADFDADGGGYLCVVAEES